MKFVHNYKVKTESLSNFFVYSINEMLICRNRVHDLKTILNNKMPSYIREDLMPLCEEYAGIFTLKDDQMTKNNFYEQKLRLTDTSPVYIKNYRLPYTQRN